MKYSLVKKYLLYFLLFVLVAALGFGISYLILHRGDVEQRLAFGGIRDVKFTRLSESSVKISFKTGKAVSTSVEYGTTELYGVKVPSDPAGNSHDFLLTGLLPGRDHNFRITVVTSGGKTYTSPNFVIKATQIGI